MNRAISPVIGVIMMVAITVILAAVIGVFVLPGGSAEPTEQPVQNLTTFVGPGGQCVLTGTFDPSADRDADRIVVEIEGSAMVFDDRTDYWRQDIVRGSNLSIYAVDLPDPGLGDDGSATLLTGYFGPECQLVRGEGA